MKNQKLSFSINTYNQAKNVIKELTKFKVIPILHIKNYTIKRFGIDWLISLKELLENDFPSSSFKFFVDSKFDYSLSINLANNSIDFIQLRSNQNILNKIKQICNKNRVLLNPSFRIVDLTNIKNVNKKISKIYLER